MRHLALLIGGLLLALPAHAQSFIVEDARPQHGSPGVALSSEVAFAFSEEISVGTDWNTAFVFEPSDSLRYNQVSLCLNFEGECGGGNDVPRFVRFRAEHEPNTDYTWMVYAVETPGGDAMDEPFVLRYTTAPTMGQHTVTGVVQTPVAKAAAWTPEVRASLRTLARGLERNGLGQPFFERQTGDASFKAAPDVDAAIEATAAMQSHVGTIGTKSHSGGHTQILLLSDFSDTENRWGVRAADVITGASGNYTVEYLREETFWPVAVRYTDGTNTEIEAFGFYDANGDGAPDPVSTEGGSLSNIDIQLYEFPLTTARVQGNLDVATDSAAAYTDDQELKIIEARDGIRPSGTAYEWTYRFYSPSSDMETRVTVDPLEVTVKRLLAGSFLTEMNTIPNDFIDSDEALQIALNDGGQAFIDPFRPNNITTILQGGNLYWTDTPVPTEEFWRVRIITATSTQVRSFDRYIDMETGDILEASDNPNVPAAPADFAGTSGDGEVHCMVRECRGRPGRISALPVHGCAYAGWHACRFGQPVGHDNGRHAVIHRYRCDQRAGLFLSAHSGGYRRVGEYTVSPRECVSVSGERGDQHHPLVRRPQPAAELSPRGAAGEWHHPSSLHVRGCSRRRVDRVLG